MTGAGSAAIVLKTGCTFSSTVPAASFLYWEKPGMSYCASMTDEELWDAPVSSTLSNRGVWPSILLALLWRVWDMREMEKFSVVNRPAPGEY